MPDLTDFSVTRNGTANMTVPTWTIRGKITGRQGLPDIDFTNGVSFPQILGTLTTAQQDRFVEMMVLSLIRARFDL